MSETAGDQLVPNGCFRVACRLVKFPMEIYLASTDDLRRVWRPWEEPPACPAGPRNDAGGRCRTQRRSCHRGQPDRERQARPPGLDGAEARGGRRRQRERSSSLIGRPTSRRLSAVGGRPFSRRAYFVLKTCRSGATRLTGTIFIFAHPLPLVSARHSPGREKGRVRKFLALAVCLALRRPTHRARAYAQTSSKRLDRPDWRGNGREARRATTRAQPG